MGKKRSLMLRIFDAHVHRSTARRTPTSFSNMRIDLQGHRRRLFGLPRCYLTDDYRGVLLMRAAGCF